jgi:hypothetical protein
MGFKRAISVLVIALVAFVLGAASVLYLKKSSILQGWITIVPDRSPTLFNMAVMKTDIPPPQPGKLEGRVKFLQNDKGIQIGYVLKLPFKPNPVAALPAKYRKETKLENGFTIGPPDQVSYTGKFTFNLEDGDGFTLAKITGPDEYMTAGADNPIQGKTEDTVPESIAKRTKKIAVSFDAEKCNICDD